MLSVGRCGYVRPVPAYVVYVSERVGRAGREFARHLVLPRDPDIGDVLELEGLGRVRVVSFTPSADRSWNAGVVLCVEDEPR